jgi:flavin-dependent dehydrogenase
MKTAIIGGGAAGFFLAVNLKELMPEMEVVIFERSRRVLAKVEVSGGGRFQLPGGVDYRLHRGPKYRGVERQKMKNSGVAVKIFTFHFSLYPFFITFAPRIV